MIIGRGVYKSTDAGRTWTLAGLREAGQIGSVIIHPTNPDIVWVAALGSPFGPTDMRGVYKTDDGGRTWTRTLFMNRETGARVLAINPSNPNELYAGMYRGFRKGWDIISGGPASEGGIYKSTDGGDTWTKLAAGLPQKLIGKIDIDVARSNPSTRLRDGRGARRRGRPLPVGRCGRDVDATSTTASACARGRSTSTTST